MTLTATHNHKPWWRWVLYLANVLFVLFAGFWLLLSMSVDWGARSAGQNALLATYIVAMFLLTAILAIAAVLVTTRNEYGRAVTFTALAFLGAPLAPFLLNSGMLAL